MRLQAAEVVWTGRGEGDLAPSSSRVEERRRAVHLAPWSWAHQVHGRHVVTVDRPGGVRGVDADGLVTDVPAAPLAVLTADCVPVALAARDRVVGAAHAGWRGVIAGVLPAAVAAMRALGAQDVVAAVGPCIGPECYEFGATDLEQVCEAVGADVSATTAAGRPALDLRAAVRAALAGCDVDVVWTDAVCTACSPSHYSWRARCDAERQAMVVWRA